MRPCHVWNISYGDHSQMMDPFGLRISKNAGRVATPSADALVVGSHSFSGQDAFRCSQDVAIPC